MKLLDIGATIGVGKYKPCHYKKIYRLWFNMLSRCYDDRTQKNSPTYQGCQVASEWLDFQKFAEWYIQNNTNEDWTLDKDILHKGNRIYGPDTCCFVPQCINSMFIVRSALANGLPPGVHYKPRYNSHKEITHYVICASCKDGFGKQKHLGHFATIEEAFDAYKIYKKQIIVMAANRFKHQLAPHVYQALINYEI